MDPQSSAPPVVAVVVTCDPGPWLEETLSALRGQDYPNLSVLVIDAASGEDPTPRVAAVLPRAYVRRLSKRVGYARAANEVLTTVEGASHYLFCHDDVAPARDAVRILLEEGFRSNAGVVSPKLVEWDEPELLQAVGRSSDKTGVPTDLAERGELDQEQHDAVRDVFVAPGGCMLVRADLFSALGGFDPEIDLFGEDLNLSWRVQVAGSRVVVAPAARVRHAEAISSGRRTGWEGRRAIALSQGLEEAHRIRTLITCYGWFHLARVLPQALFLSVAQALAQLLTGRPQEAANSLAAWPRALRHPGRLARTRRRVQRQRMLSDSEVRRLQIRGYTRIRAFLRTLFAGQEESGKRFRAGRSLSASWRTGAWRIPASASLIVFLVLLIGTRGLLGQHLPGVGGIPVTSGGVSHWWRLWWSGWRPDGLGSAAPAPPALALLSLGGTVLLGAVGVLQQLLVLGPLVLGPLGAYRAARPLDSPLGRAAAVIVYAAVPVPYNALAGGRWSGLVLYAGAPWLLAGLCRAFRDAPWVSQVPAWVQIVGLGILTALVAAFVPSALVVVVLIGLGLCLGSALAGRALAGVRVLAQSVAVAAVATVLLLPWSADVLGSRTALFGVKLGPAGRIGLGAALRFHTGPIGGGVLTWGFVLAATLPLLFGRSWRLVWAARMWGVAVVCWVATWAGSRGWLPIAVPVPEVLLAPAAAAMALAVAVGVAAFEADLRGYQFGWRQLASTAAAAAVLFGSLPVLAAASDGRWHAPSQELAAPLSFLNDANSRADYRVLWLGDPRALPLGSWWLENGVGYATSDNGMPDVTNLWPARASGATPRLASDLHLARAGLTTNLGHLLSPLAVRYIVIPSRTGPTLSGSAAVPVPQAILTALGLQVDLRTVQTDRSVTVYENSAWASERIVLRPDAVAASRSSSPQASQDALLGGSTAVLPGNGHDRFKGPVPGGDLFVSQTSNAHWKLTVDGQAAPSRQAFGWAMAFNVPGAGGTARLTYHTPITRTIAIGLETLLWIVASVLAFRSWRRQPLGGQSGPDIAIPQEWLQEEVELSPLPTRRRPRRIAEPVGVDSDELWE